MTHVRITTLLKFLSKIKWLSLQSSWCTWDVPETFLTFNEGRRRCNMDTIHERKNTFTFYYTSSILLKGWIERAGSWMKGKVLYKTKQNKITAESRFLIVCHSFFFLFCCMHTFVGVYKTTEKHVLVQHTWNIILDFKMFFVELDVYIHKTSGTKIHTKSIFMNVWWETSVIFFFCRWSFQVACQALTYFESKDYPSKACQL